MSGFVVLLALFAGCAVEGNVINGYNSRSPEIPNANGISCGRPDHIISSLEHSHIVDLESKTFEYMERITVECDDWYELDSGSSVWYCDENSRWVKDSFFVPNPPDDLPSCRPKCGQRLVPENAFEGQLSGAKKVKYDGGWPWMALVDLGGGRSGTDYCGGVLVDDRTVITAATCIYPIEPDEDVHVWLGIRNRINDNFNFTQRFVVRTLRRFVEPTFMGNTGSFDGDIAILKLDRAVDISYYVHPICLPTPEMHRALVDRYVEERRNAVLTGWGETEEGGFSEDLMKTRLAFVNWHLCQQKYKQIFPDDDPLTENMFCAGFGNGRNNACKGDSGDPLMTNDERKIWYLIGITSFGDASRRGCGRSSAYGVYTDVSKFHEFLRANME